MKFEKFYDQMVDILSSGSGFEVESWHKREIENLFKRFRSRKELIEYLNEFYCGHQAEYLRENEVRAVASLVDKLFPDAPKTKAEASVKFT